MAGRDEYVPALAAKIDCNGVVLTPRRTITEVFRNGRNINQALVFDGIAFVYWDYIAGCDRNTYARLEQQARATRQGVWGPQLGYDLMLPWDYRICRRTGGCR